MKVKVLDGRESGGVLLLAMVIRHVDHLPEGSWSYSAEKNALMDAEAGVWFVEPDGRCVQRVVLLPCACECAEVTTYSKGAEICRTVGPIN